MPDLRIYEDRALPPVINWQAVSFLRVMWPSIDDGILRRTYPAGRSPTHIALVDDDLLLSYAAVIRLTVAHAGEFYEVAGLGDVFTYPASRGMGYGKQVVSAAMRHIAALDVDVAILFCQPDLLGFYASLGWEPLPDAVTLVGSAGAAEVYDEARMMRFLSDKGKAGREEFARRPLTVAHAW